MTCSLSPQCCCGGLKSLSMAVLSHSVPSSRVVVKLEIAQRSPNKVIDHNFLLIHLIWHWDSVYDLVGLSMARFQQNNTDLCSLTIDMCNLSTIWSLSLSEHDPKLQSSLFFASIDTQLWNLQYSMLIDKYCESSLWEASYWTACTVKVVHQQGLTHFISSDLRARSYEPAEDSPAGCS